MIDLTSWLAAMAKLKFSELANVQTVGLGLYLALAVIQALSTTGVAGLRRRVNTLRIAVIGAKMRSEFTNMHRLQADVSRLEISFHSLNRFLLCVTTVLFVVALSYFAYCTVWQASPALLSGTLFVISFYLVLPMLIFGVFSLVIRNRCREVASKIGEAEDRFRSAP